MALKDQTRDHLQAHHRDFATFADLMVETHAGRFDSIFWGFVDKHTSATPRRVLDVGTGPGLLLKDLHARYPEAELIGVDAQPYMLEKARAVVEEIGERASLVAHDLATPDLPVRVSSCDLAIASMVVHELQVPTVLMKEVYAALAPGGLWVVYDWVRQPLSAYCDGVLPETLDAFTHFSEHCRYTSEDVTWMLEQVGFTVNEWMARHRGRHTLFAAHKPI